MLIGAVSHFLWQMRAKVITSSSQRWNLFSVSFSMFYHGNIKIWKAKFNQHWESEIVPRVEVKTCSHSVWASAASTALSDGDEGSGSSADPSRAGAPSQRRLRLRFVTLLYHSMEQLWLWLIVDQTFFFFFQMIKQGIRETGLPVGFFLMNVGSAKLQGTALSTEGSSFTQGDTPESEANPYNCWCLWF